MSDISAVLGSLDAGPSTPDPVARVRRRLRRRRHRQAGTSALAAVALVTAALVLLPSRGGERVLPPVTTTNPLYVTDGTKVKGYGHVLETAAGVRLCGPELVRDGGFPSDDLQCAKDPVPLEGFDTSLLTRVSGGRSGNAQFTGTWKDGAVLVETSSLPGPQFPQPYLASGAVMDDSVVPCPAPSQGWPAQIKQEDYPAALLAERRDHPDDVLAAAVLHPPDGEVLGVVVKDDAAADRVRAALEPDYGRGICVVVSPSSKAEIDEAAKGGPRVYRAQGGDVVTGLHLIVSWQALVVDDQVVRALQRFPTTSSSSRRSSRRPTTRARRASPTPGRRAGRRHRRSRGRGCRARSR